MFVTVEGIVILSRAVQLQKAYGPIIPTELPNVTLARLVQS